MSRPIKIRMPKGDIKEIKINKNKILARKLFNDKVMMQYLRMRTTQKEVDKFIREWTYKEKINEKYVTETTDVQEVVEEVNKLIKLKDKLVLGNMMKVVASTISSNRLYNIVKSFDDFKFDYGWYLGAPKETQSMQVNVTFTYDGVIDNEDFFKLINKEIEKRTLIKGYNVFIIPKKKGEKN